MVRKSTRRFKRPPLQGALIVALGLAMSPMLLVGAWQFFSNARSDAARERADYQVIAGAAASDAKTFIVATKQLLETVNILAADQDCGPGFANLLDRLGGYTNIVLSDQNGVPVCVASGAFEEGFSARGNPWFERLRDGERFVISAAFEGQISRQEILSISKRLEDPAGNFSGTLAFGLPVSNLIESLDDRWFPSNAKVAIIDSAGQVLGSDELASLVGDAAPEFDGSTAIQRESMLLRDASGRDWTLTIVPISDTPLQIAFAIPQPSMFSSEVWAPLAVLWIPLFSWLIAMLAAWIATDALVLRWLTYLRRISALYGAGLFQVQPLKARRSAPQEIVELADTMSDMAATISARDNDLREVIADRDAALKEIHHRVKNNLQIITSLLNLQSRRITDPAAVSAMHDARARINALSLIHRALYEKNDLKTVELKSFFAELADHLDDGLALEESGITLQVNVEAIEIESERAIPIALFTVEAVTNAVKHAFSDIENPTITINLSSGSDPDHGALEVSDNGVGGDPASDLTSASGLGGTLMTAFARQSGGSLEIESQDGGGRSVRLHFTRPLPKA